MSYSSGNESGPAFSIRSSPQNTSSRIALWPFFRSARQTCVPETVPTPVYGVGGTISSIGALLAGQTKYDRSCLSDITLQSLDELIGRLCGISEEERMRHPLLKERGDVILQGAMILRYMMVRTHADTVHPSDRDGMEGIAEAILLKKSKKTV